jgi:hypothetical protein
MATAKTPNPADLKAIFGLEPEAGYRVPEIQGLRDHLELARDALIRPMTSHSPSPRPCASICCLIFAAL